MKKISIIIWFIFSLLSCKKLAVKPIDKVANYDLILENNSYYLEGKIIDLNKKGIIQFGHCWSENSIPTLLNSYFSSLSDNTIGQTFKSEIFGINLNKIYYYRPYCITEQDTTYFETKTFKISGDNLFIDGFRINNIDIKSKYQAIIFSNTGVLRQFNLISLGVCYRNTTLPEISDHVVYHQGISTASTDTLDGLIWGLPYFVRPFCQFSDGTTLYGAESNFTIEELIVKSVNYSSNHVVAILEGKIQQLGIGHIKDHGFCWSTSTPNPDYNDQIIQLGETSSTDNFHGCIMLSPNTTYFFRAFALNDNQLKYGEVIKIVN